MLLAADEDMVFDEGAEFAVPRGTKAYDLDGKVVRGGIPYDDLATVISTSGPGLVAVRTATGRHVFILELEDLLAADARCTPQEELAATRTAPVRRRTPRKAPAPEAAPAAPRLTWAPTPGAWGQAAADFEAVCRAAGVRSAWHAPAVWLLVGAAVALLAYLVLGSSS